MAVDSATSFKLDSLVVKVDNLTDRIEILESEIRARATAGALQTHANRIDLKIAELVDGLNRVESKVQHVLSPPETIAFLGKEDLLSLKNHIRQLIAIKNDLDLTRKQLVDMLMSYDLGQANTLKNL